MGRIRSIKPEFPQSETVGRLSRDARLLFIQLWTVSDDSGRARGNSRILASLLYPYDDDAKDLMPAWLDELEANACIRRYVVGGDTYLEICNWLKHQKIDKASQSKLPAFDEGSAKPRESSATDMDMDMDMDPTKDLGPRTVDRTRARAVENVPRKTTNTESRQAMLGIKAKYPPDAARENWIGAERNAVRLVESGQSTWADLEAGVTRYATHCRATGRKVLNPENFFGAEDRPWAQSWPIPEPVARQPRGGLTADAAGWADKPLPEVANAGH